MSENNQELEQILVENEPSQVNFPAQAAKRTALQLIGALISAPLVLFTLSEIIQILSESFSERIDPQLNDNLVALSGTLLVLGVAFARIMAIPSVNKVLTNLGFGAQTKKAIEEAKKVEPTAGIPIPQGLPPELPAEVEENLQESKLTPQQVEEIKELTHQVALMRNLYLHEFLHHFC